MALVDPCCPLLTPVALVAPCRLWRRLIDLVGTSLTLVVIVAFDCPGGHWWLLVVLVASLFLLVTHSGFQ